VSTSVKTDCFVFIALGVVLLQASTSSHLSIFIFDETHEGIIDNQFLIIDFLIVSYASDADTHLYELFPVHTVRDFHKPHTSSITLFIAFAIFSIIFYYQVF
tara:strand:- start:5562 stop:5867 length:306 start_codon:yes stop_codon:yes gene_type:complete